MADKIKQFFQNADKNNDGVLTFEELKAALEGQGYTDRQLRQLFSDVDTSGDHKIDLDEYMKAMSSRHAQTHGEASMRKVFASFDINHDGTIDRSELSKVFKEMGREMPEKELTKVMQMMDKDKSGSVDYEEFINFFYKQK